MQAQTDFLSRTPVIPEVMPTIGEHELKNLLHSKGNNWVKRQPAEWEEIYLYIWHRINPQTHEALKKETKQTKQPNQRMEWWSEEIVFKRRDPSD